MRDTFCSSCGTQYTNNESYPKLCMKCGMEIWDNPKPVVVLVIRHNDGIYVVRRGINPGIGLPALVSGYMVVNETWKEAAARETWEEIQIRINPDAIRLIDVMSSSNFRNLLIFGYVEITDADVFPFTPNTEALARELVYEPIDLAFPTHTLVLATFF